MPGIHPIQSFPRTRPGLSRRELLTRAAAGAVTARLAGTVSLSRPVLLTSESDWKKVRGQFVLDPNLTIVNAANLCPCPADVLDTYVFLTRDVDRNPSSQNRAKFANLRKASRAALASYLGGAEPEEIALVRNTSEANNTVVAGLEMGPQDEVVVWDQNHPTNNLAWDIRAKRFGFQVRRITIPAGDISQDNLAELFTGALKERTRVLALTHVSNLSGVQLPVKEICKAARGRGVLTLVDGAQTFGSLDLDIEDLGCDFFTGSAHKWFMGPREAGILFVRQELIERIWPLSVGIGYERALKEGAEKFEVLGQRDDAALAALAKTVDFHRAIGKKKVEKRVRELATFLYDGLSKVKGIHMHTPADPESRAGVVVFRMNGVETRQALETLYRRHRVGCAAMPEPFEGIRFSPHVYNTMAQMERLVGIVGRLSSGA